MADLQDGTPDPTLTQRPEQPPAPAQDTGTSSPAPASAPVVDNVKPGQLPLIYSAATQARAAGYSWDEINDKFAQAREAAGKAGYSNAEVDKAFGISPSNAKEPPPPGLEQVHAQPDTADNIRAFSQKWLTPSDSNAVPQIHSAGDFAKMIGWDIVDVGKIFGGAVVNGIGAIVEGLDGKPRSREDQVRLGIEAQAALGLFAGAPGPGRGLTAVEPKGVEGLRAAVPGLQDTLDAAASVAHQHPEGITPETLTASAKTLGQNYLEKGEHPTTAAVRAQNDPQAMATMHVQMDQHLAAPEPVAPQHIEDLHAPPPADEMLTPEQHAAVGAAAVKQPGLISDPLAEMATEGTVTEANLGGNPFAPIQRQLNIPINPETIGQANPALGDGLVTSFRRTFTPQSVSPEGAGVIRNRLADMQANRIADAENLRRFGRAIADLPSADRRTWWHDYETGNMAQYGNSELGQLGREIQQAFDSRWHTMDTLGIAPGYIDHYLPRLYQDPRAASSVFSRRPLEGSKVYTRTRAYEYLQDAEAAGLRLVSDNPAEMALIRMHDMDRMITAHQIINELRDRGLGQWNDRPVPGMSHINDKIAQSGSNRFYAQDAVATMLNSYLSPGLANMAIGPIYDVVRSATSMFSTIKLMMSAFHPIYLGWSAMAEAFGLGLKQVARGGVSNLAEGAGRMLKSPIAPLEDIFNGQKIINYAKDPGAGPPHITTMYDMMRASGARFGRSEIYQASAAGSFFDSMKASALDMAGRPNGHMLFSQDVAAMLRNAPPVTIGNFQVAPGYIRAIAQVVPRVMDTLSDPIMGKLVPAMKAGALSRMIQEEMAAHPGMGVDDMRIVGAKFSDIIDNRIGEIVQDNLFWPKVLNDFNNVAFMAPQWFMGKIRLFTGAGADLIHGGFVDNGVGHKELSDNLTYLVGGIVSTMFMGGVYGYLKGTWTKDWGLKDYMAPPTGGKDKQGGPERIMLPGLLREAYGWEQDPQNELTNKVNNMWTTLYELAHGRDFQGASIVDPKSNWQSAGGDYAKFLAKQIGPMMWSNVAQPEANISTLERYLGIREAPFGIREPGMENKYETIDRRKADKKKLREDARESQ